MKEKVLCLKDNYGHQWRINTKWIIGYCDWFSVNELKGSYVYVSGLEDNIKVTATVSQLDETLLVDEWDYIDPIEETSADVLKKDMDIFNNVMADLTPQTEIL